MRLRLNPRLSRVVRALPQGGPLAWLEILLLVVLAVQIARLVWTVATPVGPLGRWRPEQPAAMTPAARAALFARFDPFFRTGAASGPAAVTSLSLKLYGIRMNEASGQGSAIIATPDGVQSSVAVGDEITGGVRLKGVAIDHVIIERGGTEETLYLDQSEAAPVANPSPTAQSQPPAAAPTPAYNAPPVPVAPPANSPPQLQTGAAPAPPATVPPQR